MWRHGEVDGDKVLGQVKKASLQRDKTRLNAGNEQEKSACSTRAMWNEDCMQFDISEELTGKNETVRKRDQNGRQGQIASEILV